MDDAAIGQRHVGDHVIAAHHMVHGKVSQRTVDRGDQLQPGAARPGAVNHDVGEVDRHQLGNSRCAVDVRDHLQGHLRPRQALDFGRVVLAEGIMLVDHGPVCNRLGCIVQGARQGITVHAKLGLAELHRIAPDLATPRQRRGVVDVHLADEVALLAVEGAGDDLGRRRIGAKALAVRQVQPLHRHRVAVRNQGLGQGFTDRGGVGLVVDDHVLTLEEPVGPTRIGRALQRHRGQRFDITLLHEGVSRPLRLL